MREGTIAANGLQFSYLEQGDGPLVLLLHGYPDSARTWSHLMPVLADAGYRAVAPFTRGYPPTEIPGEGQYSDSATLATDARALIEALGDGPAHVVGHDWGAATTFYLTAGYPDAVRRAVTLAIPHPLTILRLLTSPEQIHHAFHWWFFQLPGLPEAAIRGNDFAFIDYLWRLWSPALDDPEHVAGIKRMLAEPGAVESTLAYYRSLFDPSKQDPALAHVREAIARPIRVPMLSVIGSADLRSEAGESQSELFEGEFRFETVEGCGHFLHRERPDDVARLVLDWLGKSEGPTSAEIVEAVRSGRDRE